MIEYTPGAIRQIDALLRHFEDRQRDGAARALLTALAEAEGRIERNPAGGLAAPRPYPRLVELGHAWLKSRRYWVAYSTTEPPVIVGVFYETANIPDRL